MRAVFQVCRRTLADGCPKGIIDKTFSIPIGFLTGSEKTLAPAIIQGQDLITSGFGPPDIQKFA